MKHIYAIDSKETVSLAGQKYYLRIRTANADNPVVLFCTAVAVRQTDLL